MDIFKIDSSICDYYSDTKEDEEGANFIVGWCHLNECECSEVPFEECAEKAVALCKLKDKQLAQLKAENEQLKNNDVFSIRYFKDKCDMLKQTLTEIKEIAENCCINQATLDCENYDDCTQCGRISDGEGIQQILQKISEVLDVENN